MELVDSGLKCGFGTPGLQLGGLHVTSWVPGIADMGYCWLSAVRSDKPDCLLPL